MESLVGLTPPFILVLALRAVKESRRTWTTEPPPLTTTKRRKCAILVLCGSNFVKVNPMIAPVSSVLPFSPENDYPLSQYPLLHRQVDSPM